MLSKFFFILFGQRAFPFVLVYSHWNNNDIKVHEIKLAENCHGPMSDREDITLSLAF